MEATAAVVLHCRIKDLALKQAVHTALELVLLVMQAVLVKEQLENMVMIQVEVEVEAGTEAVEEVAVEEEIFSLAPARVEVEDQAGHSLSQTSLYGSQVIHLTHQNSFSKALTI